jgi:propionyl-CoA carboxylase alpha chain
MECRINAEDPFRGFLPSTGRLVRYQPPVQTMVASLPVPEGGGVRVDTGVEEGGEIPMYYDSMIAKLIVHGVDRHEAIAKMREALNAFVIRGISSNIPFQSALLAHPKFISGDFNTPSSIRRASRRKPWCTTNPSSCSRWPWRRTAAGWVERRA